MKRETTWQKTRLHTEDYMSALNPVMLPWSQIAGPLCGIVPLCKATISALKLEIDLSAKHLWFSLSAYTYSLEMMVLRR